VTFKVFKVLTYIFELLKLQKVRSVAPWFMQVLTSKEYTKLKANFQLTKLPDGSWTYESSAAGGSQADGRVPGLLSADQSLSRLAKRQRQEAGGGDAAAAVPVPVENHKRCLMM
jgi:hypothetical protein